MNDEQILDLYFARDEQAVAETDRKYGGYCFTLANSILHSDQDAEETVSDTYLRAWNTIPPKRPGIFKMFLAKITRNLAFSRWRSMNAEKRGGGEMTLVLEELDDCIAAPGCVGDGMDAKELAKARGCKALILDSGMPRKQAHRFYEIYGFEKSCYGFDYYLEP